MSNPTPGQRPAWVDDELFPFASRFVQARGATVHYVDEGEGPTLLLLHGNPTWSFLYRDLIRLLSDQFRCVAIDYPGFGLSSAPDDYRFTPREHRDVVVEVVRQLDLTDVTVMVQDWGGPIGIGAVQADPTRYRALVIGNTWVWPASATDIGTQFFSRFLGGPLGTQLIRRRNLFVEKLVPMGHVKRDLTEGEMDHYRRPFPDAASRMPTAVFPREIVRSEVYLGEVARGLDRVADLPALVVWADKDMAFKEPVKQRWARELRNATVVDIVGAGHYLQDDAPDEVADAIRTWWPRHVT